MNIKDLYNKVSEERYQVISFDLFDTLVKRPVVNPADLFLIVGYRLNINGFMNMRIMAEQVTRRHMPYMREEVTLQEIYATFVKLFHVDYSVERLVETELAVELAYCMPRKAIIGVYNYAKTCGKKVVILTDTYLSRDFIEKILANCAICGYERLYVSSDDNATKASGRLYRKLFADLDQLGISKKSVLHIGDNKKTDIKMAKEAGMAVQHVLSVKDIFISRVKQKQILERNEKYGDNNLILGYIMSELYDNPYRIIDKQTLFNGAINLLGEIVLGPFILSMVKWMLEDALSEHVEELIWIYRDGYIPSVIFDKLRPLYSNCSITTKKMYLSRNMRYYFGALDKNGIWEKLYDISVDPNMSVERFIEKRLLIEEKQKKEDAFNIFRNFGYQSINEAIGGRDKWQEIVPELEDCYYENAQEQVEQIRRYYNKIIDRNKKTAIFDVGYRASVSEHFKKYEGFKTIAYQVIGRPVSKTVGIRNDLKVKSYVEYGEIIVKNTMIIHTLIEQAISEQDRGTAITYDAVKDCLDMEEGSHDVSVERLQSGILKFVEGFIQTFAEDIPNLDLQGFQFFATLYDVLQSPSVRDAEAIGKIEFCESEFIRQTKDSVYQNWKNNKLEQIPLEHVEKTDEKVSMNELEEPTQTQNTIQGDKSKVDQMCVWLSEHHLFYFCRGVYRLGLKILGKKNNDELKKERMYAQLQDLFLQEIMRVKQNYKKEDSKFIIIGGDIAGFDKGSIKYHSAMKNCMNNTDIFVVSGVPRLSLNDTEKILPYPFAILPKVAVEDQFDGNMDVLLPKEVKEFYKDKPQLQIVVEGIYDRYPNMGENYPEALVYLTYNFIRSIFQLYTPFAAILWNKYRTAYSVMNQVCEDLHVRSFYMEFGAVPGTFSIDVNGQMGESFPAVHSEEFKKLNITQEEKEYNNAVMNYLKTSKLNRNIQPISNELSKLKEKISNGKFTVFYAGQNDYESGLFPYTENTRKFHSPNFRTSDEVAIILAEIADRNNWNIVYKPHPIMVKCGKCNVNNLPKNVIYTSNIDINDVIDACDVTVTILSQTSYLSLIREKPVVMLGYTQLKGKGCTYEAFERNNVEKCIKEALELGYTQEQKENFYLHIAQMNKYYVYDDMNERELRYGQSIQQFVQYLTRNI